jgi:hypothetical protein
MYDLATIKAMNREAGKISRERGSQPFLLRNEGDKNYLNKIPNLGTHRPSGWRLVKRYFVDSSGFGSEDESALTFSSFVKRTKVGRAYGIIEAGQFQVRIGEFVKK